MDQVTRDEFGKLYGRVNGLENRVVNLEAQQPHINAALGRIERMVERLNGHMVKAIWLVMALLIAAAMKFIVGGGLTVPPV